MLKLNYDNYYSKEANLEYMSVSQYKDFIKCEAAAIAKINGEYEQPKSDAFLLGSYVHAWNEGTLNLFKEENPDLFSSKGPTKGQLLSKYVIGDLMIKALEDDPFCMFTLAGDKEVIMSAEMYGIPWKIRMDSYNKERQRFADLKTVKDFEKVWLDEYKTKVTFVEAYGYLAQFAVYREIEALVTGRTNKIEGFMVAVTKETPPDKAIISFDNETLENELYKVSQNMERIIAVKHHGELPIRCEKCAYCKATKKLDKVIHFSELGV